MNFTFTEEQEKLRQEVHDFIEAELDAGTFEAHSASLVGPYSQEFSQKMAQKGWLGLTWPKESGGQGRCAVDKIILNEELFKVQAPIGFHFLAERQIGPAIIKFGTDWQKEYFLPKILNAEEGGSFCLLFSEPNAGSDLAGVATSAVKDGDYYIINGQKVWTTCGHLANHGWMLARTNFDSSVRKHLTCSEFIIDLKTPGVTVRPIINMVGVHDFNEVFFDDVKIHKKYLVGEEDAGFKQIMAQVDYERAGIERLMQNYPVYKRLLDHIKKMSEDLAGSEYYNWVKDEMAKLEVERNIGRLLCYYTAWMVDEGQKPTSQAALAKAFCTKYEQRLNDFATQVLGPISQVTEGESAPLAGDLAKCYLWSPSYTLQGGSNEVLMNIIALRGLGLPRK
jgi:alkylation response protein AidB-like acyl-CoA dehydrogenase